MGCVIPPGAETDPPRPWTLLQSHVCDQFPPGRILQEDCLRGCQAGTVQLPVRYLEGVYCLAFDSNTGHVLID